MGYKTHPDNACAISIEFNIIKSFLFYITFCRIGLQFAWQPLCLHDYLSDISCQRHLGTGIELEARTGCVDRLLFYQKTEEGIWRRDLHWQVHVAMKEPLEQATEPEEGL